jgi:Tryptophan halogenase
VTHNVFAVGNSFGFVEPLESTGLGTIAMDSVEPVEAWRERYSAALRLCDAAVDQKNCA